jgi:multiple sugar transport system substrate-binding protein
MTQRANLSRRTVLAGAGGLVGLGFPAIVGRAKEFDGVTLNVATYQHVFSNHLRAYLPEFEQATGMKVNFQVQAFPVYNQQADLELSVKGSAYDVCNITYIYASRWIDSGWLTNLEPLIADRTLTPSDWDAKDFLEGAQLPLRDRSGATHGFAWEGGAMVMGLARADILEKKGLATPKTFEELAHVARETHNTEGVAAYVNDRLHHWHWVPFDMGFGGQVFKDPPNDLALMLDTPEAIRAAEYYVELLTKYAPSGVLSFTEDQALRAQMAGRANIRTHSVTWFMPLVQSPDSKVKATTRIAMVPSGPAGAFPGANCQGFGIPVNARNKKASWEWMKWAVGKELSAKVVKEKAHVSICRRSVIESDAYRQLMQVNGTDVADLYLKVLQDKGSEGYMRYRTVPVFPQVGDKINKAIERIASRQQGAAEAMRQAQAEARSDLEKAGITTK